MGKTAQQKDSGALSLLGVLQEQLEQLSVEELRTLQKTIDFHLLRRTLPDLEEEEYETNRQLFELIALTSQLGNCTRVVVPQDQQHFLTFARRHPQALRYLDEQRKVLESYVRAHYGNPTLDEYSRLYTLMLKLLLRTLRQEGETVGVVSVINHLHRIPQVIEDAFPGYVPAGLLRVLVKKTQSPAILH